MLLVYLTMCTPSSWNEIEVTLLKWPFSDIFFCPVFMFQPWIFVSSPAANRSSFSESGWNSKTLQISMKKLIFLLLFKKKKSKWKKLTKNRENWTFLLLFKNYLTTPWMPFKLWVQDWCSIFQSRTLPSEPPEAMTVSPSKNDTWVTGPWWIDFHIFLNFVSNLQTKVFIIINLDLL